MLVIAILGILLGSCSGQTLTNATASTINTTPKTNTTTPPPTTPTPTEPVPTQPPFTKGTFTVTAKDGTTCINVTMAAKFMVKSEQKDNQTEEVNIVMPHNASSTGQCRVHNETDDSSKSSISLKWGNGDFELVLDFYEAPEPTTMTPTTVQPTNATTVKPTNATTVKPTTANTTSPPTTSPTTATTAPTTATTAPTTATTAVPASQNSGRRRLLSVEEDVDKQYVSKISFTYFTGNSYFTNPKVKENITITSESGKTFFAVEPGYAYKCNSEIVYTISNVTITFKDVMLQPFYNASEPLKVSECAEDESSDSDKKWIIIGACAGGVVLLAIILTVVICRKRNRCGYQKV